MYGQNGILKASTDRGSYTLILWLLSTLLGVGALCASGTAQACPVVLIAEQFSPAIVGRRDELRLFVKDANGLSGWQAAPLQVDPVDKDGRLVFFDDDAFRKDMIEDGDLLTFRLGSFGKRFDHQKDVLPCSGAHIYEIWDSDRQRYGYLTNCGKRATPVAGVPAVVFDKEGARLESAGYRYRFHPENYMQFDEIAFRGDGGAFQSVAVDSKLMIRADVRKFFTMTFDSDEISSTMEATRLGPVGNLARLSFFLKILFFKIRMSLSTDVGFYADSGHIPMMVSLPVNSYDYLHPRSGILYTWRLSGAAVGAPSTIDMPRIDPERIKQGYKKLGESVQKNCQRGVCKFAYSVDVGGKRLSMDLGVNQDLVVRGFFPMFVSDVGKYREAMGWEIDDKDLVGRMGMYFEVSGLPKGGHPWDFWLKLGAATDQSSDCPAPVQFRTLDRRLRSNQSPK